jgi:hypothetical protein
VAENNRYGLAGTPNKSLSDTDSRSESVPTAVPTGDGRLYLVHGKFNTHLIATGYWSLDNPEQLTGLGRISTHQTANSLAILFLLSLPKVGQLVGLYLVANSDKQQK